MISIKDISKAAEALQKGLLIVYPTDTLYALGANVSNERAVQQVFNIKKRPFSLPLPVAVSNKDEIELIAEVTPLAETLINHFLPGSLTIVLKNKNIPSYVTGSKDTVAIRIPDDANALQLLSLTGPLTVTSANIHSKDTPSSVDEIKNILASDSIAMYLDDGLRDGAASTIVDATTEIPKILRKGSIFSDDIHALV